MMRRQWTRQLTWFWRVRVTSEASSCPWRNPGECEILCVSVGYTPVPVCHSLVRVCLSMQVGVL